MFWSGRGCLVPGHTGHMSRDIADTRTKRCAYGARWLPGQRRSHRGPLGEGGGGAGGWAGGGGWGGRGSAGGGGGGGGRGEGGGRRWGARESRVGSAWP